MANDNGNMVWAVLTGAAIGAVIGILYAPDKGTDTRDKIKHNVQDAQHDVAERLSHAREELTKTTLEKKDAFDRKLSEAISTMSNKADEIINTLERKLEELKKKTGQFQK